MSKRLASFGGPSTPTSSPIAAQSPNKKKQPPASPNPSRKVKAHEETAVQRVVRNALKLTALELAEWEECARRGLQDAKAMVDQVTELDNTLASLAPETQPRFRVVTDKLRQINKCKEDIRTRLGEMDMTLFSKRANRLEQALTEFVRTNSIQAAEQSPFWTGKTWSFGQYVLHMHNILRPLSRFQHTIHALSEDVIAYGLVGGFHSHSKDACEPLAPGQGAIVPTFEETRGAMVRWAAEAKVIEEVIKEWNEMCVLEVVGWEKTPEVEMSSSDGDEVSMIMIPEISYSGGLVICHGLLVSLKRRLLPSVLPYPRRRALECIEMHQTDIGFDHPVAIEILSLRDALAQQQHATQQASTQVQNYASEVSTANRKARQLGAEIATLRAELDLLRAPRPAASPSPAEAELTLALRRANSRLEEIQTQLLEANNSVAHTLAERERTSDEVSQAYRLLEAARAREVELRTTLAERDVEKRVYELALGEYAALVRDLEKREGMGAAHLDLKAAVSAGDIERVKELTTQVARAKADIESLQAQLDVEQRVGESERVQLAEVRTELGKREADDRSAAALVERYMKFSQHHTDVLQRALNDQSMRHSATVASVSQHAENLERALATESARIKQLQASVDNLVEDLARESSGRRREIRIRLAIAGRTAKIEEDLRRWERRIREHPRSQSSQQSSDLLFGLPELEQFQDIVNFLGAPLVFRDAAIPDSDDDDLPGTLARILAAEIAVEGLAAELERETARRIELERERARLPLVPILEEPTYKFPDSLQRVHTSSATIPSASISIVSLQSSSGLSLVTTETSTSISLDDDVSAVPVALPTSAELHLTPPELAIDMASATTVEPVAPPEPLPTFTLPFPTNPLPLGPVEILEPQPPNHNPEVQVLLSQLPTAIQRYTSLQNTFRDCHVTLAALRSELRQQPRSHLLTAVERLYDYNEDARVEIEIRIADEARKAHGFETMLHLSLANDLGDLRAFIDGSAPDIRKALETAERKRNELEHDIAAIKMSLHAPESETPAVAEPPASQPPPSPLWGRKLSLGPGLFGTGRPMLRRADSGTLGHSRASSLGGEDHSELAPKDPLAGLGLKIPMPNMVSSPLPSPMKPGSPLVLERTRATSMYRIGLGNSRSRLDLSNRSMTVTPTSKAEEESDDGVE